MGSSLGSMKVPGGKQPLMGGQGLPRTSWRNRVSVGTLIVAVAALFLVAYTFSFASIVGVPAFGAGSSQKEDRIGPFPPIQYEPSIENPFLFLHNRKCGGTTFRKMVAKAAGGVNASAFVGCYKGDSCEIYTLNQLPSNKRNSLTVVAGHFSWDTYEKLRKNRGSVSCFTVLREPIAMFESYYYQRAPPWLLHNITLNNISVQALKELIRRRGTADEGEAPGGAALEEEMGMGLWSELGGPVNSATRMFSAAKIDGHAKASWKKPSSQLKYELSRQGAKVSLSLAKKNMRKCVVAILEDWDDLLEVVRHWYPWIYHNTGKKAKTRVSNRRPQRILATELSPEIVQVIRKAMAQDIKLYEYGKRIFAKELEFVREAQEKAEAEAQKKAEVDR